MAPREKSRKSWCQTYGTIDCGMESMSQAWTAAKHVFAVRRPNDPRAPDASPVIEYAGPSRYPKKLLGKHPVDLLVVERGHIQKALGKPTVEEWEHLVSSTEVPKRPTIVLESWRSTALIWSQGPTSKGTLTRWRELGYATRCRRVCATRIGGAITQTRLLVVRIAEGSADQWEWPAMEPEGDTLRPMSNLLTPPGLVGWNKYIKPPSSAPPALDVHAKPMPDQPGSLLSTERGIRRLLPEEIARGLGFPKELGLTPSASTITRTTSVFHWEFLSESFDRLDGPRPEDLSAAKEALKRDPTSVTESIDEEEPYTWRPPDLSPWGAWYQERIKSLRASAATYSCPRRIYLEGIEMLDIHRGNYDETGPAAKQLQLLWWEFPPEHWEPLREGSPMNFLSPPPTCEHPNANMDEEQQQVAADFVDELIDLKVLRSIEEGREILLNAPLFVVPKEGQPGQWRIIADMLRGYQNEHMAADPVVLPRVTHMIDRMYKGGYSAVVDASKFFYQFKTHHKDRPYLGILHPITQALYTYFGLPMGAGSSPGLATKYGLAFLRLLRQESELYQGEGRANCWWTGFKHQGYDPDLGHGFIFTTKDGGSIHIWAFVDDFCIHGPTRASCSAALTVFLDMALRVGMLCHPKKLIPPSQRVKYCGFIIDTTDIPCLRVPVEKRERALAMVDHLINAKPHQEFSRLSLAVVAGTLQSLVEATPQRRGQTYLKRLHGHVRPSGLGSGLEPYCTTTSLAPEVTHDLIWWREYLLRTQGRYSRTRRAATLIPTFGDGSGTGTGSTWTLPDGPLKMLKGKWSVGVFKFSSNWKELTTLRLTLEALLEEPIEEVTGTTVFYFTDNLVTYWIGAKGCSSEPRLHAQIEEIKLLEAQLGIQLQVVHVPGLVIIEQGADGLSRGVWISAMHHHELSQEAIISAIFDPLPFDPTLVHRALQEVAPGPALFYQDWNSPWDARNFFHKTTVWFPPPEIARQAILFALESWCEAATTSAALFIVPRILPAFWWGLSKHLVELKSIYPHKELMRRPPVLPIPVCVLYLPPYVHRLPSHSRLERPTPPANLHWHKRQASLMHGLPRRDLHPKG